MSDKAKSRLMIAGAALCAALFLCGKDEHSAVAEKIFRRHAEIIRNQLNISLGKLLCPSCLELG